MREKRVKAENSVFSQPALCSICQGNGTHAKTQAVVRSAQNSPLCAFVLAVIPTWSGRCAPRLHTYKSCAHRVPLNSLKKTTSGAESKTIFARLLLELAGVESEILGAMEDARNSFSIWRTGKQKSG
jgi:hypothetical protein